MPLKLYSDWIQKTACKFNQIRRERSEFNFFAPVSMYCYGLRFMIDNVHYISGDIKMATDEKKEPVYKDLQDVQHVFI